MKESARILMATLFVVVMFSAVFAVCLWAIRQMVILLLMADIGGEAAIITSVMLLYVGHLFLGMAGSSYRQGKAKFRQARARERRDEQIPGRRK